MIRPLTITVSVATAATALVLTGTAPSSAADDFGRHVSDCARTMGFDAQHNPGMHQGRTGWSPEHIC
ncbi:hypothetical protein [Pimelobacter simplex]|uniref:hypothetical protein n=1 Tax=Nocardioides simplex TaxID=2045 RepID=UPI00193196DD|nr:hypothetical protein [Pimelobacter simplex]